MNKYFWISSKAPENFDKLLDLNEKMHTFYSESKSRTEYDKILENKGTFLEPDGAELDFMNWFNGKKFDRILEVGCGQGWMGKRLVDANPSIKYYGLEVSAEIINANKVRFPHLNWIDGVIYSLDSIEGDFDLVFSFYVLEHLVFPELGLSNMMSKVKPGGSLFLVFPDFIQKKALPSQKLGFACIQNSKAKFKQGRYIDAFLSFIENRLILQPKLSKIKSSRGAFMINAKPVCIDEGCKKFWRDADAVYIASKEEVMLWAKKNGYISILPFGKTGFYANHACLVIQKNPQ
jgi:2-polyprenyl-3-methyl-5-hydroxy-6-metoxy-1,4-benzoquinol methylase